MKEILILSGKGGTGKTTITAAFACLAKNKVLADCDVDAADLHLLLSPEILEEHPFKSGVTAKVSKSVCTGCGTCADLCRFNAVTVDEHASIDPFSCEGCGVCEYFCPEKAIFLKDNLCGRWYVSRTRYGQMVHAALDIGEENSGKLVSLVKRQARDLAEQSATDWIIVDGPPGIGCPVIASLSGADMVLIVTEPTLSGIHDLKRVADLAKHFKTPACACINRWDLNRQMAKEVERECEAQAINVLGRIPFDEDVVNSLVKGVPLMEVSSGPAAVKIKQIWERLQKQF